MLLFLIQLVVVLMACKVLGWLGKKFLGQTQVVMEMVAGMLLGPSLFGLLAPEIQKAVFPQKISYLINGAEVSGRHPSMAILYVIAQIGLILYMFLVGQEFEIELIRKHAKAAIAVCLAGIMLPFALGAMIAVWTFAGYGLFQGSITLANACLYTGAAMCITAFPMLARMIFERGIARTTMGTLALGAGASGDAAAWCMLAIVLAFAKNSISFAVFAIGGGALFGVLMLVVARPLMAPLGGRVEREGKMSEAVFVSVLLLLFGAAYVTDALGIYAVFGAFIMGSAMPKGLLAKEMRRKTESLTVGLLLPFFFVFSGLNTSIRLIDSPALWGVTIAVIVAAIVGKGLGCALAAKAAGEKWREAWAIGVLMNARGLMELIILNIGLQQKIITERMYTIMVLMAIVTTLMCSPLFKWIYSKHPIPVEPPMTPTAA